MPINEFTTPDYDYFLCYSREGDVIEISCNGQGYWRASMYLESTKIYLYH